ncbi:MAG: aspartate aminotransferase [Phenylobacterium sp.]|jgi:aspartate aminotransferase
MFSSLDAVPTDPILGLMAAYNNDPNPKKIDLGVGVYKDEAGNTPVLMCVKKAEQFRLANEQSKSYMGMAGDAAYNDKIRSLLFGEHDVLAQGRVRTTQAPGGTGSLRVAAEFVKRCNPDVTIWVSAPTWANHLSIFAAAHTAVKEYAYYDYESRGLQFDNMMADLANAKEGDVVLLHACCHNPSGMDLNVEQWHQVADLCKDKKLTPMIDIAYQGFGTGLDEDAAGLRIMADKVPELVVCSSCSKNFGLYRERIGAVSVMGINSAAADIANSVVQSVARGNYSMPPAHGAAIVNTILGSDELRTMWEGELAEMRGRINEFRKLMVESLAAAGVEQDFSFIERQHGMFSFFGLPKDKIEQLKTEYSIYMVGSSRMNVAGLSKSNIDYFSQSVASVLK